LPNPSGTNIMEVPGRQFLHLAAGCAALPTILRLAIAQTYPTGSVRIVVGFAPSGPRNISLQASQIPHLVGGSAR
jgi:hypothetical protein